MDLIFKANSVEDCNSFLKNLQINIKHRKEGRNQFSLELWVLKHYLPKIIDEIDFPVKIYKSEKPDFIIEMLESKIGIEVTEATSEYYQKLLTEFSKKPNHVMQANKIRYGKTYTNEELNSFIQNKSLPLSGYGVNGYRYEIEASCWIFDAANKKIPKIKKCNKNYPIRIVIYDNTPTQSLIIDVLSEYLRDKFSINQISKAYEIDVLTADGSIVLKSKYDFQEVSPNKRVSG